MAHVSDFTQAGDKIVLDQINEDNNSALALTVVSVALASAGSPTTKNTLATVTSLPGSGYNGSVDLEYNRLAIGDFVDLYYPGGLLIPQGEAATLFDFLPEINAGLAVNLTAVDLADPPLAAPHRRAGHRCPQPRCWPSRHAHPRADRERRILAPDPHLQRHGATARQHGDVTPSVDWRHGA